MRTASVIFGVAALGLVGACTTPTMSERCQAYPAHAEEDPGKYDAPLLEPPVDGDCVLPPVMPPLPDEEDDDDRDDWPPNGEPPNGHPPPPHPPSAGPQASGAVAGQSGAASGAIQGNQVSASVAGLGGAGAVAIEGGQQSSTGMP
ncbi:hypothetical protein C2I36_11415 [Rhodobacteraceae bacterium WD3A24]|nr:hypothetical protein C2I36_11415 [Rhodobacteraceae bacterium WD3A24]